MKGSEEIKGMAKDLGGIKIKDVARDMGGINIMGMVRAKERKTVGWESARKLQVPKISFFEKQSKFCSGTDLTEPRG